MFRIFACLIAVLLATGNLQIASAQTPEAKPSRTKLTMAKWSANKPKLRACRKEVRAKGLIGDDRWFYIADCMERT